MFKNNIIKYSKLLVDSSYLMQHLKENLLQDLLYNYQWQS